MYKQTWLRWILALILIFAFWIRIYHLSSNPPELFSDEITQVLSAKSIIETGKDINGELNLFLYNKIKLGTPIYGYLATLSTYIFGNNTFAIRLPAALSGSVSIYLIYLISLYFTKNKKASLVASFIGAIVPWGVYFSRIGWEPALTAPFLLLSIYTLLKAIQVNNKNKVILSFALFAISIYASDALEFLSPLFLGTIILIHIKKVWSNFKKYFVASIWFLAILIPLVQVSLTNPLKHDRSFKISTFRDGLSKKTLIIFKENYIAHFNYDFLFKTGDPNLRHGTTKDGVLYFSMLPLIIIGLLFILKDYKNKNYLLLIFWLFYFPLGGSLTNDGIPHATRTLIGWPLFTLISAVGIKGIIEILKKEKIIKFTMIMFFLFLFFNFNKFFVNYFVEYPITSESWWEYGQRETYQEIKKLTKGYESLCLGNIDYWHEETLNHYYLGYKHNYKIIYDTNNPQCLTSDIIVLPFTNTEVANHVLSKIIFSPQGHAKWGIYKLN